MPLRVWSAGLVILGLSACQQQSADGPPPQTEEQAVEAAALPDLPPGSNEILRADLEQSDNLEVIISDVVIPPGAQVPRHTHPGEEFVYVIEGGALHIEEGKEDQPLKAGEALVIRPGRAHEPIGGAEGGRAIVFRVHVKGEPERTPAPNEAEAP